MVNKISGNFQIIQYAFRYVNDIFFISHLNICSYKQNKVAFKDNSDLAMSHVGVSAACSKVETWSDQNQWN